VPIAIQAVFEENREGLSERVDGLEAAVSALLAGGLGEVQRTSAARDAHKLAGSLAMFGLEDGSDCARELEHSLKQPDGPIFSEVPRLAELALDLRECLDSAAAAPPEAGRPATSDAGSLLIVSSDPELCERLSVEALGRDLQPRSAATPAGARRLIESDSPDGAVLDVNFGQGVSEGLDLLADLAHRDPPVPVVVLTGSEALVDRVEVARRGARLFVARTRPATQVIAGVREQIGRVRSGDAKVLAVDDDPAISSAVAAILESRGMSVTTLDDPLGFWELLEATEPDLLILDLDMPGLNGIDLCQAVRADGRFGQLPIVFLTGTTEPAWVEQIFEAGADDFVAKPIVGPELATRVRNRLDRVRLYRDLAEKDGLTGVASRRGATGAIEALLASANRFGQPVAFALIDVDEFRDLNAGLGHTTGDAVLRRLGTLMAETFRSEDVIGRWGDNEFVLGMSGLARDDAVQRVAETLEVFRQEWFTGHEGRRIQVSFSAGVAEYPGDGASLHQLDRAAADAVRAAKASGRDRVLPAGAHAEAETHPFDVVVVEDDEVLAGLLIDSLETRGYRTRWLKDGQDALTALSGAEPDVSPALVLLDVDLPGLDGLSVLRRLAEDDVLSRTRVILLTARAGEQEVVGALELGAFDYVAKPFSLPVLMQRVRSAMRR